MREQAEEEAGTVNSGFPPTHQGRKRRKGTRSNGEASRSAPAAGPPNDGRRLDCCYVSLDVPQTDFESFLHELERSVRAVENCADSTCAHAGKPSEEPS